MRWEILRIHNEMLKLISLYLEIPIITSHQERKN